MARTVEQMCRDLLEIAIRDGLVLREYETSHNTDPQARTAGDLCGMANALNAMISEVIRTKAGELSLLQQIAEDVEWLRYRGQKRTPYPAEPLLPPRPMGDSASQAVANAINYGRRY